MKEKGKASIMFKSIRTKLISIFTLFLIITTASQLLFNIFFAQKFYIMQRMNDIENAYNTLINNYSDNQTDIYKIIRQYEENCNVRIIITKKDKSLVYGTMGEIGGEHRNFNFPHSKKNDTNENNKSQQSLQDTVPPNFLQDNSSDYKTNKFFENINEDEFYDAKAKLIDGPRGMNSEEKHIVLNAKYNFKGETRYIILECPVVSIQQSIRVTTRFTLYTLGILLIFGIIFVYIFSCSITKPIKEIDSVAQGVVNQDFSLKATVTGKDEISNLSKNINTMSEKISEMLHELMRVNEELENDILYKTKLDNIRKEFVANVSHELKTPIALIMGYSEMLKSDMPGIDKDFYYDVIMDESNKMNKLVCQLLNVSNMEYSMNELNYEKVNLSELVRHIIDKNKISIDNNKITFDFDSHNVFANCDKMKIEQAITNYISNAVFHSKKGSHVTASLIDEGNSVTFKVFNEGTTIKDSDIGKIWNIFYKADKSRTDRQSTGLGLYIVSIIINAHKGEYSVENKENGVEFCFKIPK